MSTATTPRPGRRSSPEAREHRLAPGALRRLVPGRWRRAGKSAPSAAGPPSTVGEESRGQSRGGESQRQESRGGASRGRESKRRESRGGDSQRRESQGGESQRQESPRRWPWFLALVLVGAFLGGAVYAVFFSPLLALKSVAVTGAPDAVIVKVQAVVDVPTGTPLARVDLDDIAAQVEAVPEIADVEVSRGWPDTLSIALTPMVPVAVTSANGQFWLLDAAGDPYLSVPAPPAGLITIALVAPGAQDQSTVAALDVIAALTPDFRAQVLSLSARTAFDIELTMADGKKIIWGEVTGSAQKMQILPALLAAQEGTEYDVSDPTLVTVR